MPPSGDVKTLKKQCQEGLDSARQMLNKSLDHSQFETYIADTYKSNPIERARAMQADLRKAENFKSSVSKRTRSTHLPAHTHSLF